MLEVNMKLYLYADGEYLPSEVDIYNRYTKSVTVPSDSFFAYPTAIPSSV